MEKKNNWYKKTLLKFANNLWCVDSIFLSMRHSRVALAKQIYVLCKKKKGRKMRYSAGGNYSPRRPEKKFTTKWFYRMQQHLTSAFS